MQNWRLNLLFYFIIAMMASLFLSRYALSITMIAFCVIAFLHKDWQMHFSKFFRTRLLWGMSLLFLLPLISGLWSSDQTHWLEVIQIKLPLLFLPLSFAGPIVFSERQWKMIASVFIGVIAAACAWSLFHYSNNMEEVNKGYLQARSLITPLQNDHVRFSWLVNIATVLSFWFYTRERMVQSGSAIIFFLFALGFIIYLHILAARTGIVSFYICLIIVSLWLLFKMKARWLSVTILAIAIILPVIAYLLIPSFQNRIRYMRYDWSFATDASYQPSTTDAVRKISMIGGWELMKSNPSGVGFGDLPEEMNEWYAKKYPQMIKEDKILPSSEWLVYGAAAGVAGLLIFTLYFLISLDVRLRFKLIWYMLQITAALSFLIDIGLEVQFGVFLYAFIVLWWWKWFSAQNV